MNRTVRDVAGLILSIILMVSLYGTYKGGTMNVGASTFRTMHRMAGNAFNKVGIKTDSGKNKPKPAPKWSADIDQDSVEELRKRIPDSVWRKGVKYRYADSGVTGSVHMNDDGTFQASDLYGMRPGPSVPYDNVAGEWLLGNDAHQMTYNPSTNSLLLT